MANNKLLSMTEAAAPLYLMALMLGHEDEEARLAGAQVVLHTSVELASFIYTLEHTKTCARCSARQKMTDFLRDLTSDRNG